MNKYMQFARSGAAADAPERTVLVLDVSPSMEQSDWKPSRLGGATEASNALLEFKAEHYPRDQVGIVSFSGSARAVRAMTEVSGGISSLKAALSGLKTGSATNITAGLVSASSLLTGESADATPSRLLQRIIGFIYEDAAPPGPTPSSTTTRAGVDRVLLLTDGEHNTGPAPDKRSGIAEQLKERGVCIDVIGIGGRPRDVNASMLKRVASKNSDGSPRYCFIGDKAELVREFKRLAQHLKRV